MGKKKQRSSTTSIIPNNVDVQNCSNNNNNKQLSSLPFMQINLVDNANAIILINTITNLQVVLLPENDLPHPRHLCFHYPFMSTSHKRHHCIKCFCFVCDTGVPCCKWARRPERHCDSTMEFDLLWMKMKILKLLNKPHPLVRYKLFINLILAEEIHEGLAGGIILDQYGKWITGFTLKLTCNDQTTHIHILTAILEGLKLASSNSESIKILDIHLGIPFEPHFITSYFSTSADISEDKKSGVSLLPQNLLPRSDSPDYNDDLYSLLDSIDQYLNDPSWEVVNITEAETLQNLSTSAYALIHHARLQAEEKQIYEFPSDPLTESLKNMASLIKRGLFGWIQSFVDAELAFLFIASLSSDNVCLLHDPPCLWLVHHSPRNFFFKVEPVFIAYQGCKPLKETCERNLFT